MRACPANPDGSAEFVGHPADYIGVRLMESPRSSSVHMEAAMVNVHGKVRRSSKQTLIGDHR
jgi:hypothetical protein